MTSECSDNAGALYSFVSKLERTMILFSEIMWSQLYHAQIPNVLASKSVTLCLHRLYHAHHCCHCQAYHHCHQYYHQHPLLPSEFGRSDWITPGIVSFCLSVTQFILGAQLHLWPTSLGTCTILLQRRFLKTAWSIKVVLLGHKVPGKGRHKIMEYICASFLCSAGL